MSRWYGAGAVNETGRTVSLAAAALMESGVDDPARHIFLAASGQVATLIVGRSPFSAADVAVLQETCKRYGYTILLSPGSDPASDVLKNLVGASGPVAATRFALPAELSPLRLLARTSKS